MDIIELLKILSIEGLKFTIEYNYDYDAHLMTVSIGDIEHKIVMSVRDGKYMDCPSEWFIKELRRSISSVRNRYKEVCRDERH